MMFCSLLVAALTACGGGGGAGTSAVVDSASGAASAAAGDGTGILAVVEAPDVDRDGSAGGDDILVADAGSTADASSTTALSARSTNVLVLPIAAEGRAFKVAATMTVRYGIGSAWVSKAVTDNGTCTSAFFGSDPAPGVVKSCQVLISAAASNGTAAATVGLPDFEGTSFFVFGTLQVEFGANGSFVTKTVTGHGDCTTSFFGSDPAHNVRKSCQLAPPATTTTASAAGSLMPSVDIGKVAAAAAGYATARARAANVADPGQIPVPSNIGDFREYCEFSHMSYDDPIAAPGGLSAHLHTFLGNTAVNANSTADSIAHTGNSTCAGGTLNRTAYWVPSVIDTQDGTPQRPVGSLIYYKQGYNNVASTSIRPFPAGLRIVAGNSASSAVQDFTGFTCTRPDGSYATGKAIPTDCPAGATLTIGVAFPQCWDGVNLDSPDHKSHMAYPHNGCPATHPVPLTGITFNINYKVGASGTSHWRLSSDNYDRGLPGGYSSHADWFNGWNDDILDVWTTRCINASMDCHAFLIGDGRILY